MKPNVPWSTKRRREVVALVGECGEDRRRALERGQRVAGDRRRRRATIRADVAVHSRRTGAARERYAVVSCHVERPLDDAVWARFSALQEARPGGFAVAALMRPPDAAFGEDEGLWIQRAREASERGPIGHHTHWTAPDHARPTGDGAGARVLEEGRAAAGGRLRAHAVLRRRLVHGRRGRRSVRRARLRRLHAEGVAAAVPRRRASAGRRSRHRAIIELPSGRELRAIPTTHSLGDLARALTRRALAVARPRLLPRHGPPRSAAGAPCSRVVLASSSRDARRGASIWTHSRRSDAPTAPRVAWDDVTRL